MRENASAAFLEAVRKSMRAIRTTIGAMTINPDLLTRAEKLHYEGYLRREDATAAIRARARDGVPIRQIVHRTGRSRRLVRPVIRDERGDVFRVKHGMLDPYLPMLDMHWASGGRSGAERWRRLKAQGFKGSLRVVSEWATRADMRARPPTPRCRRCLRQER
jgi:transposase